MRRILPVAVMVILSLAAGCGNRDKTAEKYAGKLSVLLKDYQMEVARKVDAEKASYEHLAGVYGRARDRGIIESLNLERNERVQRLADSLTKRGGSNAVTLSEVHDALRSYGEVDFVSTHEMLARESTALGDFLSDLESLEVETSKVQALQKALDELAKPKSGIQRIKDLKAFAEEVDAEYGKLICSDLVEQIQRLEKQLAEEADEAKKKPVQAQIDRLKTEKERRKCP